MSVRGTVIMYNGVQIDNVSTESIEQTAHFDSTDSDQVGVKVSISVTGILHRFASKATTDFSLGSYVGDPGGGMAGENLEQLRPVLELLNTPYRRFQYVVGDFFVWDVAPISSDNPAAKFGSHVPTPAYRPAFANTPRVSCNIIRVISDTACWVRFQIEFVYNPCDNALQGTVNNIVSLRWWCADDIDTKSWLTKRVWSGVIELKSREINAHMFRYLAFPPLPSGWRRDGVKFTESENGLMLHFEIVDQETVANPPFPASEWKGSVSIQAPFAGIGLKDVDINIELQAPKDVEKDRLAFLILTIMDSKIQWYNFASKGTAFVKNIRLQESIAENVVSGDLSLQYNIANDTDEGSTSTEVAGFPGLISLIFGNKMGDPAETGKPSLKDDMAVIPKYNPDYPTYWVPKPDSLAYLLLPMIQTPCASNAEYNLTLPEPQTGGRDKDEDYIADGQGSGSGSIGGGAGGDAVTPVTTSASPGIVTKPETPYMIYRLSSRYLIDKGISAFPVYNKTSGTGQTEVVIAKMRQPITRREFRFEATRINKWPVTPTDTSWTDDETGIVHTCDEFDLIAHNVEASADGRKYRYSVSGVVTYVLSRTPTSEEKLFIGAVPHITGLSDAPEIDNVVYLENERREGGQFKPDGADYAPPSAPPPSDPVDPPPGPVV